MKKGKDKSRWIKYIVVLVIISLFICKYVTTNTRPNVIKLANPIIKQIFIYICLCIIIAIIMYGLFSLMLYLFTSITKIHLRITKLSKADFIKDKQLYRDILNNYSPAILSYVDNMKYNYDISVVSILLSLKNKGYIEFEEDKIKIIKFDFYNLNEPEKYIMENIKNGKVENANKLEEKIIYEGKQKGILADNENWKKILVNNGTLEVSKRLIQVSIFSVIYIGIIMPIIKLIIEYKKFSDIIMLVLFFIYVYIIFYGIRAEAELTIRTKKGKELNHKIEGLKNYLKEYSLLGDRTSEELELWEDYLIYSVIFNQNKDIVEEYKKYYL